MSARHAAEDTGPRGADLGDLDERARLLEAQRRAVQLSAALNKINEALMSALTPDDVLASMVGEVSEAAGADKCLVIEVNGDVFTITYVRDVSDDLVGQPKPAAYYPGFALAAAERRPILIEDNWTDPRTNKDFVVPNELRAFQLIPLIVDDRVIAVLAFAYDEPRTFDRSDFEMADRMTTAMSLAMKNAQLYVAEREAREQTASIIGSISDGFCALDRDWRFVFANEEIGRMLGLDPSAMLGRTVEELYDREAWEEFRLAYAPTIQDGRPVAAERYFAGTGLWLEGHAFPWAGGMSLYVRDVTERKRAERELRESREDLDRAQALGHTGGWRLDAHSNELRWSDETYRMFGIPLDTPLTYELFLATIHPDDREHVDASWQAAMRGEPYDIEHRIVVDGAVRWVRELAELELDKNGDLLGGFGSVHDITERKLVELGLKEEARRVHAANRLLELFAGEEDGDGLFDEALGVILEETESAYGVFGYMNEEGDLVCPTMSRIFDVCEMDEADKCIVYKQHKWSGLWGRALREGSTLFTNGEATVPDGHMPIHRNLAAAIVFQDEVIGLVNLANKATDYTDEDCEFVDGITDRLAPVLYAWIQKDLLERERAAAEADREAERVRLREIIEDIPVGVALVDRDGAVIEINEATDRIWAGELPKARSIEEYGAYEGYHCDTGAPVQPHEWPAPRAIATGERVEETVDIRRLDGMAATIRVDAIPITDGDGSVARVVVITEDVTQRLQTERLKEAIQAIGSLASSTFDVSEILHRVLSAATDALGTEASTLLLREGDDWVVKEVVGPAQAEAGGVFATGRFTADETLLDGHRAIVVDDVLADDRLDGAAMSAIGIRSLIIVPIVGRSQVLGVMAFHYGRRAVPFTTAEIDFATELIGVTSLALDNAALYEREHLIADTLQEAILAPPEPMPDVEVSYLYRPASSTANVGGDFHDVFKIDAEHIGILIGDVSGKGLQAARHTSLVRTGVRAYVIEDPDPAAVLGKLNTLVHRSTSPEAFATVFFGALDRIGGVMRFCGAGHPQGLVGRSDGVEVLPTASPIVGAFVNATYETHETCLAPGDRLLLYTDGILEARRGAELFGEERIVDAMLRLASVAVEDIPERLLNDVLTFSGGELHDDTVVMCLTRTPQPD